MTSSNVSFNPSSCEISVTDGKSEIKCDGIKLDIDVNGKLPTRGTITLTNGKINKITNLKFDNYYVNKTNGKLIATTTEIIEPICTAVTSSTKGTVPAGNYIAGDEYICKVNDSTSYNFFVLSKKNNDISLIMANDVGESAWLSAEDYDALGGEDLHSDGGNCEYGEHCATNIFGPVTAMNFLYNATKNWTNIPNVDATYNDDSSIAEYTAPALYGGVRTTGNITTIIKKDLTPIVSYTNLKARMANITELSAVGCPFYESSASASCPAYITSGWTVTVQQNGYSFASWESLSNAPVSVIEKIVPIITIPQKYFKN